MCLFGLTTCHTIPLLLLSERHVIFFILLLFMKNASLCTLSKIFNANNDRLSVVKHPIEPPITAAALRFHPTAWSGDMCMRVEAFGCDGRLPLTLCDVLHMCIVVITRK